MEEMAFADAECTAEAIPASIFNMMNEIVIVSDWNDAVQYVQQGSPPVGPATPKHSVWFNMPDVSGKSQKHGVPLYAL